MFRSFYGLTLNPFDKSLAVKHAFNSKDHKNMMDRLNYLQKTRGVGVFTAAPGMGKTYALRCFADTLNPNIAELSYICLSTVSINEFYRQLCLELGLEPLSRKADMFKAIQERVRYLLKEKKKTIMIAVDECQYLDTRILRDLKMLTNQDYDSSDYFALVLVGLPHVNNILAKPVHEALAQRVVVHYNCEGLTKEETTDYVYTRIEAAGGAPSIIEEPAIHAISGYSNGVPRIINSVMTNALLLGAQLQKKAIDSEVVLAATNNLAFG
ncbi:MAG: AAA family ATPase [Firmicutes bacterium]|jgi:type II secretory pathway predicted ATPase ExeA|nr:AAA family ATPase [Bacillota bacterium]